MGSFRRHSRTLAHGSLASQSPSVSVCRLSVQAFYDGLASEYHLIFRDWDAAVERQGLAIARLIRGVRGLDAQDVLDCSCGIGTQAIGLAREGYRVFGTDISERAVERARGEAARLGQDVAFGVADFRDLDSVAGTFDVVISCDNSVPHLLDLQELETALRAMSHKLRPGGLLLISIRDYDQALVDRASSTSRLIEGPPRRVDLRVYDWEPDCPVHTVHVLLLSESGAGWTVSHHHVRYRALTRSELTRVAEQVGFIAATWHDPRDIGYYQPVFTAIRPE